MFRNESGFTLYEQLVVLTTVLFLLPLISLILQILEQPDQSNDIQVFQSILFIQDELFYANEVDVKDHLLHYKIEDQDVTFKLVNHRLRRIVNGGNEDFLFGVESFKAIKLNDTLLKIEISLLKEDNVYEKVIFY